MSVFFRNLRGLMPAAALVLAGCAAAPEYHRPPAAVPAAYKESPAHAIPGQNAPGQAAAAPAAGGQDGRWQAAAPAEHLPRGEWWRVFGDETLDALERRAETANQDLEAAAARLAQARALRDGARADRYPRVDAGFGPTRQRPSPASQGNEDDGETRTSTLWRASLDVSYEADLFGRVAAAVQAADADLQRSAALFRSVQLALQADVAQAYFLVRERDAERELYAGTVALRERTRQLVASRHAAGDIGELDLARADAELASARAELLGIERQRAAAEHALAVLLGLPPAEFSLPARPLGRISVAVPAGLPSSLLERRPDIAAAERAMAAANARIGAARAAFFPRLDLTGALGYESSQLGNLFEWSSRTFLLGPLVGAALSLPIFDGGRREAGVALARARYEEDVAAYRQTVLSAFREVEDQLANLRILDGQSRMQDRAVEASARAAGLSQIQYREGEIGYLEVIDADRSVLVQRRASVRLDGERARSAIALIRALGGSWEAPAAP